ncbi:MAG: polyphenol oxidase family protein [Thermoanaerobaculia bacterium]
MGRCAATLAEMIGALDEAPTETSWLRQVHSGRILDARPGCSGEGDALLTRRSGLAVAIATADCVPVVLAGPRAVAVVHAGWRGIAAGIVPAAVLRLAEHGAVEAAWIGPAIGPCCYEVGEDVADRVEAAAGPAARVAGRSGRKPHLDLVAAVEGQLRAAGVPSVESAGLCTRCRPDWHSFRRDGAGAGRNWTLAWLRSA